MRRGKQVEVPSPGQNQKVAAFGGINYATGESLSHVPDVPKGGKNSAQFLVWLWKLVAHAQRRRKRIILLIDNGPIHTAKKIEAFIEDPKIKKLIKVIWLPKYAPDLNDQDDDRAGSGSPSDSHSQEIPHRYLECEAQR
jgi:hypothetical protein